MKSNVLTIPEQGSLPLVRRSEKVLLPLETVLLQPNLLSVINLVISASGLEDKELYIPLGIDAGHWTRMRKGDAHFPTNKIDDLMTLCNSEAPLEWQAHKRGKGLVLLQTEAERQLEEMRQKFLKSEEKVKLMSELFQGRVVSTQ